MSKKDLVSLARKNGVADEALQTFEGSPDGEYNSVTEVEHAFHDSQGGGKAQAAGNKGEATKAAQKGGRRSHGGHSR